MSAPLRSSPDVLCSGTSALWWASARVRQTRRGVGPFAAMSWHGLKTVGLRRYVVPHQKVRREVEHIFEIYKTNKP